MHPSTIAAILAFAAGMPANAAPPFRRPLTGTAQLEPASNRLNVRGSDIGHIGKAFEGEDEDDATGAVADVITIDQAVQGSQPNDKRDAQRGRNFGKFLKGASEGVGAFSDLVTIGGLIGGQPAQQKRRPREAATLGNSSRPAPQKREAQRGRNFGKFLKGASEGVGAFSDLVTIGGLIGGQPAPQKREAQRGRNFGKFLKGASEGVGAFSDLVTIGGLIGGQPAPQKREAQRGRNFGKFLKGASEGVGAFSDLVTIGGLIGGQPAPQKREAQKGRIGGSACLDTPCGQILPAIPSKSFQKQEEEIQPTEKRDAQRSRGRVFGNIVKGVGGAIGGAADLITIGGAVQGQGQPAQKRDAQRSRGRVFGNIVKGVGGAIGGAADLITIGGAVQGQGQPAQKRALPELDVDTSNNIFCKDGSDDVDCVRPLAEKREATKGDGEIIDNTAEGVADAIDEESDVAVDGEVQG
ncbi:hypothetical protein P3342_004202 [Pyrenophora teres f. teres]|nr:hypothetical protein P3342_004202 [Pyrenophora teres f. teres]